MIYAMLCHQRIRRLAMLKNPHVLVAVASLLLEVQLHLVTYKQLVGAVTDA